MIEMLTEGLPLLIFLVVGTCVVQFVLRRVHFDSEDVLIVTAPDGSVRELRLSALRTPKREEELRKITAKAA